MRQPRPRELEPPEPGKAAGREVGVEGDEGRVHVAHLALDAAESEERLGAGKAARAGAGPAHGGECPLPEVGAVQPLDQAVHHGERGREGGLEGERVAQRSDGVVQRADADVETELLPVAALRFGETVLGEAPAVGRIGPGGLETGGGLEGRLGAAVAERVAELAGPELGEALAEERGGAGGGLQALGVAADSDGEGGGIGDAGERVAEALQGGAGGGLLGGNPASGQGVRRASEAQSAGRV